MEDLADLDQLHASIIQETAGTSSLLSPISGSTSMPLYEELECETGPEAHVNHLASERLNIKSQ
jgi:hypothetical protein